MADIRRVATGWWSGDLRGGKGTISSTSGVLNKTPFSFSTRFENQPGTNPEELIAAAQAGCFSMALAARLSRDGFTVESIDTEATCVMVPKQGGGFSINRVELKAKGKVQGIDAAKFQQIAQEVKEGGCPVSIALKAGIGVDLLEASLA